MSLSTEVPNPDDVCSESWFDRNWEASRWEVVDPSQVSVGFIRKPVGDHIFLAEDVTKLVTRSDITQTSPKHVS